MPSNQTQKKTKKIKRVKTPPPMPPIIEKWLGEDDRKITMYENKHEPTIWNYYDKKKFWLKHKGDAGFLIIECHEGDFNQHDYDSNKAEMEDDDHHEQHNVGECECKDCTRIQAEMEDDEPPCEKCGCRDEVEQCAECDAYICIECDESEMATYGEGHDACTMCHECGVAYEANTFVQPYKGDAEPPKEELKHPAPATKCLTHDWKEEAKKLGYTIYFCADKKSKTFYHNQQRALGKIRKGQKTFKDYAHDWSIIKQEKAPGEPSKRARRAIEEVDKLRAEVAELRELVKQLLAK